VDWISGKKRDLKTESELVVQLLTSKLGRHLISAAVCLDQAVVKIERHSVLDFFQVLKLDAELCFNFLVDITCVDWLDKRDSRFEIVYHLLSLVHGYRLCVKVDLSESDLRIDSLTGLWPGADFMEREVWDMFGVEFNNHPDLRRILMYDEFVGHPLRKDYPLQKKQPRIKLRAPEGENTSRLMRRPELDKISEAEAGGPAAKAHKVDETAGTITTGRRSQELSDDLHSQTVILNIGPSHPATHGTVRIVAELSGEKVVDADVEVGYLHRGFEKMCENVDYNQVIPYTDRLNYVSPVINNVGWCLTVEKLLGVEVPKRCQYIRVLLSEISRICDHLTCLGASAMELGAFSVMLYMMEAREYLYDLLEEMTGARITVSFARVGGIMADLTPGFGENMQAAFAKVRRQLADCDRLLTRNRIFIDRMCDIGTITLEEAVEYSLSGPLGRASGLNYDVRKAFPYSSYDDFDFEVPLGSKGDNYDRFLVRFQEMEQSMRICEQAIENLPAGPIALSDPHIVLCPKDKVYSSIEGMISHFELIIRGVEPPAGDVYLPVEGGNGELGFYTVSDGSGRPYRVHVRAPAFIHMGVFAKMITGHSLADIVPTFGMQNMIGGECDR